MESTNDKLAVRYAPVQLEWTSDIDNAIMCLDEGATLDFGLNQSNHESFYKIRVPMMLKGSRKKVSFFLLIIPEDIRVFDITSGPSTTLSLHTTLSQRSSFLVVPRSYALQNKKAYDTFDLLKSLSRATSFSCHLTDAKDDALASLQAASKLFAESRGRFRTDSDEYGLDRFYHGAGGVVQKIDHHPPGSTTGSSSPDPLQLGYPPLYAETCRPSY
ncbi:hypothetical protein UCDDS831_g08939 [Diplodia seriata]|uniref:Uncharacterized protein n=1 Tax=Diplodia seriata TaxID=420778 RepID=A0A0G2FNK7_9PEZI|nr:hypothetical protein UCDDS831_g08939 [Diplodia seriata]